MERHMLLKYIGSWLDERLGAGDTVMGLLSKPLKGGARYLFSLGALNLFLFTNQALTGLLLMMYYAPTPDHAYDSVRFIQNEASFGYLIRGFHYWGASAMIVSVMLHALRVFVFGAYKKPREVMWLSGTFILLIVFGFAFTGYLLPWDQKSYWATVVGTNVAGTAPFLGGLMVKVLRGGTDVSAVTLSRFFAVHTILLPWLLIALAGIHLTVLQLVDHTEPWDREKAKVKAPFYPDQVFKDMTISLLVFVLLMVLATISPSKLEALADPTDHMYNPRPEWYFYFLFQILHYTEGKFEIIGTMVFPTLFVALLLFLPFIDRNPSKDPKKRPVAMSAAGAAAFGYIALTVLAVISPPAGVSAAKETKAVTEGRKLYAKLGCASCHAIRGVGGVVGPSLDHVSARRDREWMKGHFKDPQKFSPGSVMPKFDSLTDEELDRLTDYMTTLK